MSVTFGTCAVGNCQGNGVKRFDQAAPVPQSWHLCAPHLALLQGQADWPAQEGHPEAELSAFFRWLPSQRVPPPASSRP